MSFKLTRKQIEVSYRNLIDFENILAEAPNLHRSTALPLKGPCLLKSKAFIVSIFKIDAASKKCYLNYLEVESTGLQIPFCLGSVSLFWLDAETGYIYSSVSALPIYVPLYNLKGLIESLDFNWEVYLKLGMNGFNPTSGFDWRCSRTTELENVGGLYSNSISYDKNKSTIFNYINFQKTEVSPDKTLKAEAWGMCQKFFNVLASTDFYNSLNIENVLGNLISVSKDFLEAKESFDYLLLENSFQSPIMKDFLLENSFQSFNMRDVIKKAEDANILNTLNMGIGSFYENYIKKYFDDESISKQIEKVEDKNLFPYEIVLTQFSKLVRRFKIKGII